MSGIQAMIIILYYTFYHIWLTKAFFFLQCFQKKELGDKQSDSIDKIRQLLPIPKRFFEVMSCEAHGTQMDSKGNKYDGFGKKEVSGYSFWWTYFTRKGFLL